LAGAQKDESVTTITPCIIICVTKGEENVGRRGCKGLLISRESTLYNIGMSELSAQSLRDAMRALGAIEESERTGTRVALIQGYGGRCKECGNAHISELELVNMRTRYLLPFSTLPGFLSAGCPRVHKGKERKLGGPAGKGLLQGDELALLCNSCRAKRKREAQQNGSRAIPDAPRYDDDEAEGEGPKRDPKHLTYLP
jgi:hypothetical protein